MNRPLIFGGTTEGRALAGFLEERGIPALLLVATEYGESLMSSGAVRVRAGRLDEEGMRALLMEEKPPLVVDATHPYAEEASRNIRAACAALGVRLVRVLRESVSGEGYEVFLDMESLVSRLNETAGIVFSALGVKQAQALTGVTGFETRVFLRVLPDEESLKTCLLLGYPAKHLILMQGPFSKELNAALLRFTNASILLTKEAGKSGGFLEKLAAAREAGAEVKVLARPGEADGIALEEAMRLLEELG